MGAVLGSQERRIRELTERVLRSRRDEPSFSLATISPGDRDDGELEAICSFMRKLFSPSSPSSYFIADVTNPDDLRALKRSEDSEFQYASLNRVIHLALRS